jgi:hypothetical protein
MDEGSASRGPFVVLGIWAAGRAGTKRVPNRHDGGELARKASTWRELQLVQAAHDKDYHADVAGLSKAEQLRHYALHTAKLAGATAAAARAGADPADWLARRVPDMLLFGLKLATVTGLKLADEALPRTATAAAASSYSYAGTAGPAEPS